MRQNIHIKGCALRTGDILGGREVQGLLARTHNFIVLFANGTEQRVDYDARILVERKGVIA